MSADSHVTVFVSIEHKVVFFQGLIFRFKFLMAVTLLCAALTVIFFIIGQVSEGHWKWGDQEVGLEYTSAFLTGTVSTRISLFATVCWEGRGAGGGLQLF